MYQGAIPGFYILQTPSDGHCLLHAIIGSWGCQVTNLKPPSLESIKCQIFAESINNAQNYIAFLSHSSKLTYTKQLKDYILHGLYNSAYGDIVPTIISNALSISIKIYDVHEDSSQRELLIVPGSSPSNLEVSIHRRLDHFSALKPISLALSQSNHRLSQPDHSPQISSRIHRQQSRPMDNYLSGPLPAYSSSSSDTDTTSPDSSGTHRQQTRPVAPRYSQETRNNTSDLQNVTTPLSPIRPPLGSGEAHRQQPRPVDSNLSQSGRGTIKYTSDQLRKLMPVTTKIPRKVRKRIFENQIWKPKNGPHRLQPWPVSSANLEADDFPTHDQNSPNDLHCLDHNPDDKNSGSHGELLKFLPRSNIIPRRSHNFHLALVNARSIRNKTQELLHHAASKDLDACVITETWLNNDDTPTVAALQSGGYNFQHVSRSNSNRGGGLGILHKDSVNVTKIKSSILPTFELCLWKVKIKHTEFVLAAIYRPPYSAKHKKTVPMFISEFSDTLTDILAIHNNHRLILVGDFNIHMDNPNSSDTKAFNDLLTDLDCIQHVKCKTHEAGHIIDLCITPATSSLQLSSPTVDHFLSDHAIIEIFLSIPKPPIIKTKTQSRSLRKIDGQRFQEDLISTFADILEIQGHDIASEYNNRLSKLLNKHAPIITKLSVTRPRVAWFDSAAKELKRQTRTLFHKWMRTKDPEEHNRYKTSRNNYRQHLDNNKRRHLSEAIQAAKGDPKKLFSITLGLMGKVAENPLPSCTSDAALAEDFAEFFVNKIERIRSDLIHTPPFEPVARCTTSLPSFQPLSETSVNRLIKLSKPTTCLLDPLPTKLVKEHIHLFTPAITKIVNNSLSSAHFYDEWKSAVVTPLLKKRGLETIKTNYRPVSNLSFVSKIAEKGVIQQLSEHFTTNNLHSNHQSAYKHNFSIETTLYTLVNDILWA